MPIDRLYKTLITIPAAQIGSGGVSGFSAKLTTPCFAACPELVTLGSPYALQAGAGDLLIYDSTGTLRYAVDVIRFDLSATWTDSVVEINFGQLSLSSVMDGTFWLYSGHASPQSQPAAGEAYGQYAAYETAKVGYWPLSDGSGLTAYDRTNNANSGTLTNGPTWSSQSAGNAGSLSFDGGDDYVRSTTFNGQPLGNSSRSISSWIRPNSGYTGDNVFVFFGLDSVNPHGHGMYAQSSYRVRAEFDSGTGAVLSNTALAANTWNNAIATYNGATHSIYINGVFDNSASYSLANTQQGEIHIGQWITSASRFGGLLDDIRIYNRALSASEVTTVYNSTNSPASFCVLGARQSNVTGSPATYRRRAASRYGISL